MFVLEVDATASKVETWHAAAAAREDRIAALQVRPTRRRCASCSQLPLPATRAVCRRGRTPDCVAGWQCCHGGCTDHPSIPSVPCPQSPLATEGDEAPQQPSSSQQPPAPAPAAAAASSSSSKAATTRARRLSLPGTAAAGSTSSQAAAQAPAASATGSSAGTATAAPTSSASSSASGPVEPPAALSAQPALPEAQPLPQRRVRFEDSPVKTHKLPEEEAQEEAEAAATPHVQPHLAPIRTAAAAPAAALLAVQPPLQQAAPQRAGSPSKTAFDAALAARGGLPTLAAAAAAAAASSPRKSAAALAVPMSELIHSVASLSRAGREATHRKTNQVGEGRQAGAGQI